MDTVERTLFIGFYTLMVIVGLFVVGSGMEAHILLNRLEARIGEPYEVRQGRFYSEESRFYNEEIHFYYAGYRQMSDWQNVTYTPGLRLRAARGNILYIFGTFIGYVYIGALLLTTTGIGIMAYRGNKHKQSRHNIRRLFWSGVFVLLTIPFLHQSIVVISYFLD